MPQTMTSGLTWAEIASCKRKKEEVDVPECIISREELLARREYALKLKDVDAAEPAPEPPTTTILEHPPGLAPPPGLDFPKGLEEHSKEAALNEEDAEEEAQDEDRTQDEKPEIAPEVFQVLLRNLPDHLMKNAIMQVMLEQARLFQDVVKMDSRPGGKAVISFTNWPSASKCISHFHGRLWGNSGTPVTALYVRTVKKGSAPVPVQPQCQFPAFIYPYAGFMPGMMTGAFQPHERKLVEKQMSADAPVFVPSSVVEQTACNEDKLDNEKNRHGRFFSDASTEAGPLSEASYESEGES